jgi:[acyl-carrier-protein] S-malonyltransferase
LLVFQFPGQGSQSIGMGRDIANAFPAARCVFEAVDEALGEKLSGLIWEGAAEELTLTHNAQPALMAMSLAVMAALDEGFGIKVGRASYVAGHSLGEYSALAAAGALSVADAARLLRLRGQAMQRAVAPGIGAMAALLGASMEQAEAAVAAGSAHGIVVVANDNAEGQIVISGEKAAVEAALVAAKEGGVRKAMSLPVSAPFHCPLMAPAAEEMRAALVGASFHAPSVPVVANVTVAPVSDPATIKDLLVQQVTGRVRWRETVNWLAGQGVTDFVEVGAGKVLTGVSKRAAPDARSVSLNTPADLEAFAASLNA